MMTSDLFRRGIIVPKHAASLKAVEEDSIDSPEGFWHLKFSDQKQFERIWSTGLFSEINEKCHTLIDDYEQESVSEKKVHMIIKICRDRLLDKRLNEPDRKILNGIADLAENAAGIGMPLFFIL